MTIVYNKKYIKPSLNMRFKQKEKNADSPFTQRDHRLEKFCTVPRTSFLGDSATLFPSHWVIICFDSNRKLKDRARENQQAQIYIFYRRTGQQTLLQRRHRLKNCDGVVPLWGIICEISRMRRTYRDPEPPGQQGACTPAPDGFLSSVGTRGSLTDGRGETS